MNSHRPGCLEGAQHAQETIARKHVNALLVAMRDAAEDGRHLYVETNVHWNPAGHEFAARAVAVFQAASAPLR